MLLCTWVLTIIIMSKRRLKTCEAEQCENTSSNCDLTFFKMTKDSVRNLFSSTSVEHDIDNDCNLGPNKQHCPRVQDNESVVDQLKARNARESNFKEIISCTHRNDQYLESSTKEFISNCNQRISNMTSKCNNDDEAKISFLCSDVKNDLLKSQAKLFECTQQIFDLENAVRKKQNELDVLKEKLKAKEQQCDSYFKQIEALNSHRSTMTNNYRLQNQKLLKLKGKNIFLRNKLVRLKGKSCKISFLRNFCLKLERKLKAKYISKYKRQMIARKRIERFTTIPDEKEKEKLLRDFLKNIEEKNSFFAVLDLQPKISVNKEMTDKFLCQLDSSQNISDVSYSEQNYIQNEGYVQQSIFYNDLSNNICLTSPASKYQDITFHPNYSDSVSHAFSKPVDKPCTLTDMHALKENMALSCNVLYSNETFNFNSTASNLQNCFSNYTNENTLTVHENANICNISCKSDDIVVLDSTSQDIQVLHNENTEISTTDPSSSSFDMRTLPSSSEDVVCLESMLPVKVKHKFEAHNGEANCVLWLPTLPVSLLTGGAEKTLKHWSVCNLSISMNEYSCSTYPILTLDSDLKKNLIALSCGLTSQVWDISEFKRKYSFIGHKQKVMASKFLKPDHTVVTASLDRTMRLWSLDHGNCISTYKYEAEVLDVESKNGNLVIGGHSNGIISFWDIRTSNKIAEIVTPKSITSLNLSKAGTALLSCLQGQGLKIYDLRLFKESSSLIADEFSVSCDWTRAKFSPDDQYCCCGSMNGSVFIWNVNSNAIEGELIAHNYDVPACCWSTCGSYFASCDSKGHCIIWSNK